jgi:hypothetical protein
MLGTDLIAIAIALIGSTGVMILAIRKNVQLEKENAWLRERVNNLRQQVSTVVDKELGV